MSKLYSLTFLLLLYAFHASGQFITVWNTNIEDGSTDNQITIQGIGTGYSITWEEIGFPANNGTAIGTNTHTLTFPSPGTYQISITPGNGTFTRFFLTARMTRENYWK